MSLIGEFGLCSKSSYEQLSALLPVKGADEQAASALLAAIIKDVQASAPALVNHQCSGEVFVAVFDYLEVRQGLDTEEDENLLSFWQEVDGELLVSVFNTQDKERLAALAPSLDYAEIDQYVNDFFQADYGQAGQAACRAFLANLNQITEDKVLIFHIF